MTLISLFSHIDTWINPWTQVIFYIIDFLYIRRKKYSRTVVVHFRLSAGRATRELVTINWIQIMMCGMSRWQEKIYNDGR